MSIADKITRLQTAKTNIATAITNKGGTVSSGDGFEDFSSGIATIQTGITPTGTISITANGTHDVTNYASANVDVSMFTEETIYISTYTQKIDIGSFIYSMCGSSNKICKISNFDEINPAPYALIGIEFGLSHDNAGAGFYSRYNSSSSLNYGFGDSTNVSIYPVYGKRYKIQKGDVPL